SPQADAARRLSPSTPKRNGKDEAGGCFESNAAELRSAADHILDSGSMVDVDNRGLLKERDLLTARQMVGVIGTGSGITITRGGERRIGNYVERGVLTHADIRRPISS